MLSQDLGEARWFQTLGHGGDRADLFRDLENNAVTSPTINSFQVYRNAEAQRPI